MTYKVISAVKEREFLTQYGTQVSYILVLKDESGTDITAKLNQKPETPKPEGTIEGHIEQTQYGPKFVKERPVFGLPHTPANAAMQERQFGSFKDTASIERQVSLKGAIEFAGYVMAHSGKKTPMKSADVIAVAEAFDAYLKGKHAEVTAKPKDPNTQDFPPEEVQTHSDDLEQLPWEDQ